MKTQGQILDREALNKVVQWNVLSASLPEVQKDLRRWQKDLLTDAQVARGAVREAANQNLVTYLPQLLNRQPLAVRLNAIIVLALLNEEEAAGARPAVPLASAIPALAAQINDPKQVEVVKYWAVKGLSRWRGAGQIPSVDLQFKAVRTLVDALKQNTRYHPWIRREAVIALGAIGRPDPKALPGDGEVLQILLQIVGDSKDTWAERTQAAVAIGRIKLLPVQRLNCPLVAHRIVALAVEMGRAYLEDPEGEEWRVRFTELVMAFAGDRRTREEGILKQIEAPADSQLNAAQQTQVNSAYKLVAELAIAIVQLNESPEKITQRLEKMDNWLKENTPESQRVLLIGAEAQQGSAVTVGTN
jgi:hypothetical protein